MKRRNGGAWRLTRAVLVGLTLAWSAFPILLIVLSSFKVAKEIFAVPPTIIFEPTLENYRRLIELWPKFFEGLWNSLLITIGATLLTAVTATLAGYAYSRFRSRFMTLSAFFMIFVRMLPPIIVTLPLFPVVNLLHLNDTHLVLVILYAAFFVSLATWIMKTFIDAIPYELEESAAIDGATTMQRLTKVVIPLSVQGMIASCVFVVVFSWNEFIFALVFVTSDARTAPLVISEIVGAVEGVEWGVLFAAASVQLLPILLFVLLVQRYIVAGLTAGSVKG